ncbi:MAG: hypothetical protein COB02_13475 [Candidatus Cloacimonadota bacterium]|nr:MAG: hypothetical protein COB02_13475 [Candidatus Cloacimonadota bacterium]
MYKNLVFLVVVSSNLFAANQWQNSNFDKIEQDNKAIIFFFHASWCSWCHKLKDEVFSDKEVQKELSKYHLVSVDGDDKKEGTKLKKKLGVSVFPTLVYQDSNRGLIDFATGYKDKSSLLKELEENLTEIRVFERLEQKLKMAKDFQTQLSLSIDLIDKKSNMGFVKDALDLLNKVQPKFDYREGSFDLRVLKGSLYYKLKDYKKAVLYMRVAIESAKTEKEYRSCTRTLIRAYNKIGKKEKRFEIYQKAIDLYPSVRTYNSFAWTASQKKKHLEKALIYVNKAIEKLDQENGSSIDSDLSKKQQKRKAGILDTLAEVHYAKKSYLKAYEVSQWILKLNPKSKSYLKKNKKYKKKL